jgi:hypothetical protein
MQDTIVQAKATAAQSWVGAANVPARKTSRKHWRHVLIPITASATLAGLLNIHEFPAIDPGGRRRYRHRVKHG